MEQENNDIPEVVQIVVEEKEEEPKGFEEFEMEMPELSLPDFDLGLTDL